VNKQDKHVLIRLYYTLVRASRQIPCIFSDFLHTIYFEFESRSGQAVQHYVITFVSDLRQVGSFLRVLRFHPSIQLIAAI
jgi:hypothetical protein